MKNFFTILFAFFVFAQYSSAQVLFSHDFEDGTLGGMTVIDNDGLTLNPQIANSFNNSFKVIELQSGNMVAAASSWFSSPGKADNWLITPAVTIEDANTIFKWVGLSPNASFRDGYRVMVSTSGNTVSDFT